MLTVKSWKHTQEQMHTVSMREAVWTLRQDNRRDMARSPQKYAFSLNLTKEPHKET